MCRYNQLWGCVLAAFGFGILIGTWLSGGFVCHLLGFSGLIVGCCLLRNK